MAKTCLAPECNNPVFGGGFCKYHQNQRTDKKLKTPRKVSERGRLKRAEKRHTVEIDKIFYLKIWEERLHICFETGEHLGDEPLMTFFHHVLEKSNYPQYRHCHWNIVLLRPEVHNQVHTNIDRAPKVKALTEQLKEKYG